MSWNTGDWNTGDWNTGDWNTGDWNTGDCNTGCFCEKTPRLKFFDKDSGWIYKDWRGSEAYELLKEVPQRSVFVYADTMSEGEKINHPEYEINNGYLKTLTDAELKEATQQWWDELSNYEKGIIRALPNFNKKKFERIMHGICI